MKLNVPFKIKFDLIYSGKLFSNIKNSQYLHLAWFEPNFSLNLIKKLDFGGLLCHEIVSFQSIIGWMNILEKISKLLNKNILNSKILMLNFFIGTANVKWITQFLSCLVSFLLYFIIEKV